MKGNPEFLGLPKHFWANVRSIGQKVGYTVRGTGQIRVPALAEIRKAFGLLGLTMAHLADDDDNLTELGARLLSYFEYRAQVLYEFVQPRLMEVAPAKELFEGLRANLKPKCPIPMNKQKGEKRAPAYFTGIINMLVEANADGLPCDYSPRELTTVTLKDMPLRTLARWVDGAFPSAVNPIAVWEVKEYYYTTTFGSRVADGVYESLLDGMELEELHQQEGIEIQHLLMVDGYQTWWLDGRSYLCRIIDMLHMGYADEVLFGYEVVDQLPRIVKEWVEIAEGRVT